MKKTEPKAAKQTFWNTVRVANNLKIGDIADMLEVSYGTAGGWFSGGSVPSDEYIAKLCKFFEVDYETGRNAFYEDNKAWRSERGKITFPKKRSTRRKIAKKLVATAEQPVPASQLDNINTRLARQIYGKVSYDAFVSIQHAFLHNVSDTNEILQELYGKLCYTEFNEIFAILNSSNK